MTWREIIRMLLPLSLVFEWGLLILLFRRVGFDEYQEIAFRLGLIIGVLMVMPPILVSKFLSSL